MKNTYQIQYEEIIKQLFQAMDKMNRFENTQGHCSWK
jgi:hypothetical protein